MYKGQDHTDKSPIRDKMRKYKTVQPALTQGT